jgi:hypothetical protein|tara:strand:+ start:295 stop:507 length:213 start_codon:yes stop_codon:yes gene_type:complete
MVLDYPLRVPVGIETEIYVIKVGYTKKFVFKLKGSLKDSEQFDTFKRVKLLKGKARLLDSKRLNVPRIIG